MGEEGSDGGLERRSGSRGPAGAAVPSEGSADGPAGFRGETVHTAVDPEDADSAEDGQRDGSHAKDHDDGVTRGLSNVSIKINGDRL